MSKVNNKPVMRSRATPPVVPAALIPQLERNNDQADMEKALGASSVLPTHGDQKPSGFKAVEIARQGEELIVGQTYRLPLHRFKKSDNNARVFYLPIELDEMSQSLSTKGQDTAVLGYVEDGKVVLTDGQKRYQSSVNSGLPDLKVEIIAKPDSEADEYEASRRINLVRSAQTGIDDAFKWRSLLDRGVYESQDQLAERLGERKEKISKILGITRIPDRLVRTMVEHEKTRNWTVAYLISTIFDAKRQEELGAERVEILADEIIGEVIKQDLSKRKVEELINRRLQGPQKRAQAESTPVKYGSGKGDLKIFVERGQLDLSLRGLSEDEIGRLKQALEKTLLGQMPLA